MIRWILLFLLPLQIFSQTITLTPIGNQDVSGIPIEVEHEIVSTSGTMDVRIFSTHYGNGTTSQYASYPMSRSEMDKLFDINNNANRLWWNGTLSATTALNFSSYYTLTSNGASVPTYGNYYSLEATCLFVPSQTGTYSFRITSDDGSDLEIDGTSVIEWYGGKGIGTWKYGTIYLTAGNQYFFKARMQEYSGGDGIRVQWQRPSGGGYSLWTTELGVASSSWVSQGTLTTNTNGEVTFPNTSNNDFRVTIDVSQKFHLLDWGDLNYMMYKKANLSPIEDWDFYTLDLNNSSIFSWDDIVWGYDLVSTGTYHNKYIFTQSEKDDIESNPTNNYYWTYFPTQIRTITSETQFYIMGTGKHKTTIVGNTIQ